jgi:hypothetical protein
VLGNLFPRERDKESMDMHVVHTDCNLVLMYISRLHMVLFLLQGCNNLHRRQCMIQVRKWGSLCFRVLISGSVISIIVSGLAISSA